MAFCTSCGTDVGNNRFCTKCGAPIQTAAQAAAPQPASAQPYTAPPPTYGTPAAAAQPGVAPAPKKISPIVWVLVGIFGFFVLIGIAVIGAGVFFVHKVAQNPALVTAKLLAAANPNLEVLSSDEGAKTVTFRDKKTGETVTMNFDELKRGQIKFKGRDAQGKMGEATMNFGGAAEKLPDWVPSYPGAAVRTNFSATSSDGAGGNATFTTPDPVNNVLSFYEGKLKDAGFKITANATGTMVGSAGGMLSAEDEANKRTMTVIVGTGTGSEGTTVNLTFGTKK